MNISAPFITRRVATTLLTLGIALAGALGFSKLPVSPLPQVDFPTISVTATLPGASPDTVATSVAEPLERHLGQIADVTEMTSQSGIGQTRITLQFDINRDIDGAARDVQAAINAARADLPANMPSNPTYRKVNPADAPILILALTSKTMTRGQMYDAASNILAQRLAQLNGVGNVIIGGSTLPAVRVELNPQTLYKYGIGLEDVRAALASANANSPKGTIDDGERRYQIYTNDQANVAADYAPLVVAYRNGAAVRLSDVAQVQDSVQDVRNLGLSNGRPSVLVILFRQPNANIIQTIDNVEAELPHLEAAMPADMNVTVAIDRSVTIRASLHDTELTLVMAVILVTLVVFLFLRNVRATLIPSVAVPVSIVGTFGVMYLFGYSLDLLSLMALTIATGFVVDDAIVVLENISRHMEEGMPAMAASLRGAREVGFTVLSISLSLIAVFTPILLMGGILGRLFREFTVTLSVAILISLAVSLTTTPMMCGLLLRPRRADRAERRGGFFDRVRNGYARTLTWALRHRGVVLLIFIATLCLNVELFIFVPKGFFPQQDTGRMVGSLEADQSISFQLMSHKLRQMMSIVQADPAVQNVVGYTGVGSGGGYAQINRGNVYVALKPLSQRKVSVDQVIARLRPKLAQVPGGRLYLAAIQDLRAGGRQSNAQYQYTLQSEDVRELYQWTPKLVEALEHSPVLVDVSSDQQQRGLETYVDIDRDTVARLGISPLQIDNTLYDAFGQRQVSVIYSAINQYHVVMEADPRYTQYPDSLRDVYVSLTGATPAGTATTNAAGGTVTAATAGAAQLLHQRACQHRTRRDIGRRRGVHGAGDDDTAGRRQPLSSEPHAAVGQSPGTIRRLDHLIQSATGQIARRGRRGNQQRHRPHQNAGVDPRHARRHGAVVPAIAVAGTDSHSHRHRRRLHPARRAVRELCPPDHNSLDPAVGWRRRPVGADGVPYRIRHHRDDRRHPVDRHRQEERDHDDRLCHRGQAGAQPELIRRHLRSVPVAPSPDPDDHLGGDSGRGAAGAVVRQRRRNPSPARYCHRRRPADQPVVDALHDAGPLPLSRPCQRRMGAPASALVRVAAASLPRTLRRVIEARRRDARPLQAAPISAEAGGEAPVRAHPAQRQGHSEDAVEASRKSAAPQPCCLREPAPL
jgi:multidrug efflux pump